MLNKRTNVLFSEDEHSTLIALSQELGVTMGELIRRAVRKTYEIEDKKKKEIAKRKKAFKSILKLRKQIDTKGINYRELIEHGRKY